MTWDKKYIVSIFIWVTSMMPNKAICQKISTDSLLIKALSTDQLLPALISAAQKFSPETKRLGAGVDFATANQKVTKNNIFSGLSLLSSYHYGTNYQAVNELNVANSFTTIQSGFYNVGVSWQLPLTHIINRKHFIKATQAQINMASYEKDGSDLYVKQEVIRLYQDLKLSHRLMLISSNNRQSAQVNYKMIEKEFSQGQTTVESVARIFDIYSKSKVEYETFLNRFQTSLMQLDAYTGVSFSTLLNQLK
jgi:outer membrane protein TolC